MPDIRATWASLLESLHSDTLKQDNGPKPWEVVADKVRVFGSRLHLSPTIFPIGMLVPLLEKYSLENQKINNAPSTWVVDSLMSIDVPYSEIVTALENMVYSEEAPFRGSKKAIIGADLLHVLRRWLKATSTAGRDGILDGQESAEGISAMLDEVARDAGLPAEQVEECQALRLRIEQMLRYY